MGLAVPGLLEGPERCGELGGRGLSCQSSLGKTGVRLEVLPFRIRSKLFPSFAEGKCQANSSLLKVLKRKSPPAHPAAPALFSPAATSVTTSYATSWLKQSSRRDGNLHSLPFGALPACLGPTSLNKARHPIGVTSVPAPG